LFAELFELRRGDCDCLRRGRLRSAADAVFTGTAAARARARPAARTESAALALDRARRSDGLFPASDQCNADWRGISADRRDRTRRIEEAAASEWVRLA